MEIKKTTTKGMTPTKEDLFGKLLEEYMRDYLGTKKGIDHLSRYPASRKDARVHYERVAKARDRGDDTTDDILLHFLPHSDSSGNRDRGAWIHVASAINKDLKSWFEGLDRRKPGDWPEVASLIWTFVSQCTAEPGVLAAACNTFSGSPYSKGLQTGMLTPFLNALMPQQFALINSKSRRILNYFLDASFKQSLTDYPAANTAATRLLDAIPTNVTRHLSASGHVTDILDSFSHWIVSIRKHDLGKIKYWKIAPGEQAWQWEECRDHGFIAVGWDDFGDISQLSRDKFNQRRDELLAQDPDWGSARGIDQLWKFGHGISEGDRIIANKGTTEILGIGTVVGSYYFVPGARFGHRFSIDWDDLTRRSINERSWKHTLIPLNKERFDQLANAPTFQGNRPAPPPEETINPHYTLADCARDTGFPEATLGRWVSALERKRQAIIYGPPGTGKTYLARHLAKHLVGNTAGIITLVQFHPSYAYEDFIQGIRPAVGDDGALSYPMVPGRFLDFCSRVRGQKSTSVLIIDEINRANLSKVFGELMYLLEYRGEEIPLAGGDTFSIPENLVIIGTMNTADRSIALVDHALRRRFAFLELHPQYNILQRFHTTNGTGFNTDQLITLLKSLNKEIDDPHYEVGMSFFMLQDLSEHLEDVWRMEIEPYLVEYFFDQRDKVARFRWEEVSKRLNG